MNPAFQETLARVRERLLAERGAHGHWEGELSSSALSTATAVLALALVDRAQHVALLRRGLDWLRTHANPDGGWGDTIHSKSNISTTALVWAALGVMNETCPHAEQWLAEACRGQKSEVRDQRSDVSGQQNEDGAQQQEENEHRTPNIEHPTRLRPEATPGQASKSKAAINPPPSTISAASTINHAPSSLPNLASGFPDPTATIHHSPSTIAPEALVAAIAARYGKDRTFSVPILTACALAGKISWDEVLPLPFELAVLPHQLFRWLRLPVVSYALPALIAIGQVRHHHLPPRNAFVRALRNGARAKSLRVLEKIQPTNGGFLEAAPLTSFVVMSLAGMGLGAHPVAAKGVQFLVASARADGSWPIDTNLATWLTTLAVNALGPEFTTEVTEEQRGHGGEKPLCPPAASATSVVKSWLIAQQYRVEHPFTHAAPGGWSWTDLPGGVPDADDTAGALLALKILATDEHGLNTEKKESVSVPCASVATSGIQWLLDLQNRDGGIPTFCRGWGALPFDRSAPDLTAHALRAFAVWREELPPALVERVGDATQRALHFLARTQRVDGAWIPLWFGNQHAPREENLTYGTAQVLRGLRAVNDPLAEQLANTAAAWLMAAQNPDGSWGGAMNIAEIAANLEASSAQAPEPASNLALPEDAAAANTEHRTSNIEHRSEAVSLNTGSSISATRPPTLDTLPSSPDTRHPSLAPRHFPSAPRHSSPATTSSSLEETALAVAALAGRAEARKAVGRGVDRLIAATDCGRVTPAAPIGLYFAKLWYFERLYPLIFLASALERVAHFQALEK